MPFYGGVVTAPPVVYTPQITYRLADNIGTTLLNLHDRQHTITVQMDFGMPDGRTVIVNRPGADGTLDTTAYHGARAVTWQGVIVGTLDVWTGFLDTLRGLCHPAARPYLYATRPGWTGERRMLLRADAFSAPLTTARQVQVTWRGVDGVWESAVQQTVSLTSSGVSEIFTISDADAISNDTRISNQATFGIPYPRSYPYSYGSGGAEAGVTIVESAGTVPSPPLIRIYGQCTSPKILCATTGVVMSWPGLSIADGAFLEVDCAARTSLMGGNPGSPEGFDFSVSDWASVPPGTSQWQTAVATSGDGFQVTMGWRDRWL